MGFFEKIFGTKPKVQPSQGEYKPLTAYQPTFTSYNGQIYESELVRASIHAIATNTAKLKIEIYGHGSEALRKRLERPNAFMTWSQFMYRLRTIYEVENTAFIVPVFDKFNRVVELYPVLPSQCKLVSVNNEPWLAFQFRDGMFAQLPVWQVGLLTKFQYRNDVFGESNRALTPTMELVSIQNQGIKEALQSAATYRFIAQYNNVAFGDDLEKEQERFNKTAAKRGGLALLFPKTYDNIKQIDSKPFVIDAEQMGQIKNNVFDYFGVNDEVVQGKAYGDKWTAFYENTIEPFAIQFSEVMTRMLVLCGQLTGDNGVMATANRLQYMSNAEKLNVSAQLADRGILNRDEVREIWNLPPIPDGSGKAYTIRGEYKNAAEQLAGEE